MYSFCIMHGTVLLKSIVREVTVKDISCKVFISVYLRTNNMSFICDHACTNLALK